jgi:environmental stress-induced protein Ves
MRWRNGGGETAEVAVFPASAGLDDFGWRVSMATVEAGGPFSIFPGVDRTLSVLEGEGMALDVEGRKPVTLTGASEPYSFPADVTTNAELVDGPIIDLNVMTRRASFRHKVVVNGVNGRMEVPRDAPEALLFCQSETLLVGMDGRREELRRFDAALLHGQSALTVEGNGRFLLIELSLA